MGRGGADSGARKDYETIVWGKMPVKFRPRDFRRAEVEEAVRHLTRSFPDVPELVPDFSLLSVGRDPKRNAVAVLRPGDESKPTAFRRGVDREEGDLVGLLCKVARHVRSRRR